MAPTPAGARLPVWGDKWQELASKRGADRDAHYACGGEDFHGVDKDREVKPSCTTQLCRRCRCGLMCSLEVDVSSYRRRFPAHCQISRSPHWPRNPPCLAFARGIGGKLIQCAFRRWPQDVPALISLSR